MIEYIEYYYVENSEFHILDDVGIISRHDPSFLGILHRSMIEIQGYTGRLVAINRKYFMKWSIFYFFDVEEAVHVGSMSDLMQRGHTSLVLHYKV